MTPDTNSSPSALLVLRTAHQHHSSMGAMADVKASFLLAASLLVFALAISGGKTMPLGVLTVAALATAIAATLALTPRVLVMREGADQAEVNLLFCGHFSEMDEAQYVTRLRDLLGSEQSAQDALARDLYQTGLILHQKKFRHLATAYTVALLGLGLTGAAWAVSLLGLF
jgi:Family of unknown function (DUF5706)